MSGNLNTRYKIIPTPQSINPGAGEAYVFAPGSKYRVSVDGAIDNTAHFAADFLCREAANQFGLSFEISGRSSVADAGCIILSNDNRTLAEFEARSLSSVFEHKYAREQGYIICSSKKNGTLLYARSGLGLLYAVSTLLQLLKKVEAGVSLDSVLISDYPDYKYRGNCWLILAEVGIWSYDRGDGADAYFRRVIEKLDMCVRYKVNMLLFDGMGWSTDRFAGYAELMRNINREARLRGIHLMFVGYGAGYGAAGRGFYRGQVFQNLDSYPDGEVYACLGGVGSRDENLLGRINGTCLTNAELMRLKCEELRRFVYEVEPGAMYIHNLDNDEVSRDMWLTRCPKCRERWPSDDICAADGMAGAYADFYDSIAECVKSVKKPGYEADRDCVLYMVSPGYTMPNHSDEAWRISLDYWASVSRYMRHRHNVSFMFREQFHNHDTDSLRCVQMRTALDDFGQGHEFGIIYFYGADGFHNDRLYISTPAYYYLFEGADGVISAAGNAYQEPHQLLSAEYLWNSKNSSFYIPEYKPRSYSESFQLYWDMMNGKVRPEELFASDGFLGTACAKLYGEEAGKAMAEMFALQGTGGEYPVPYAANHGLNSGGFNTVHAFDYSNEIDIDNASAALRHSQQTFEITTKARNLLENYLSKTDSEPLSEIEWYYRSLCVGARYAELYRDYMIVLELILKHFEKQSDPADIQSKIVLLLDGVSKLKQDLAEEGLQALDYLEGALCGRERMLSFFESSLANMQESLSRGERYVSKPAEMTPWW